jgi:hypothetical protein
MSHIAPEDASPHLPSLAVIRGLTYTDRAQIFNRWLVPIYQTAFRWMGNSADSEDATAEVVSGPMARLTLPAEVQFVNEHITDATLCAMTRHWSTRYGVPAVQCGAIHPAEAALLERPPSTVAALFDGLSAEMRLVILLRFLRKRSLAAIGAQLGMPRAAARSTMVTALTRVAERIGLARAPGAIAHEERVAAFVDALVAGVRPPRFDVDWREWSAMVGATHLQAAIAGNDLPDARFVRRIEQQLRTAGEQSPVTSLRIWSA